MSFWCRCSCCVSISYIVVMPFTQFSPFQVNVPFLSILRSSPPEMFLWKGVLKICSKFTDEHTCRSVISKKLLCNSSFSERFFLRTPPGGSFWCSLFILNGNIRKPEICLKWFKRALILILTDTYNRTQLCDSLFKASTQRSWF